MKSSDLAMRACRRRNSPVVSPDNTSRNAWRDLYVMLSGEDRWIPANLLRQQASSRSDSQRNQEMHRSGMAS